MNEELKRVMELYQAPFECKMIFEAVWVEDSQSEIVCDAPSELVGELIVEALNEYFNNHKEK